MNIEEMTLTEAKAVIVDLASQKGTLVQRCFFRAKSLGGNDNDALRLCVVALIDMASDMNEKLHQARMEMIHKEDV
jgi:hypothetical protein